MSLFENRIDAGRQLAAALRSIVTSPAVSLGLARGGLVAAAEVARELGCDLDVLVARKVGAPHQPEYGIGAIAPGGITVHDPRALERLFLSGPEFEKLAAGEGEELERRLKAYRGDQPPLNLEGKTAIVVDDGIATGVTALAACRYARTLNPVKIILAVPVCTAQARALLEKEVDEFVCLAQPEPFYAVGQWYQDFTQVEDDEVLDLLRKDKEP